MKRPEPVRETFDWAPERLLCKRWNVPDPYKGRDKPPSSVAGASDFVGELQAVLPGSDTLPTAFGGSKRDRDTPYTRAGTEAAVLDDDGDAGGLDPASLPPGLPPGFPPMAPGGVPPAFPAGVPPQAGGIGGVASGVGGGAPAPGLSAISTTAAAAGASVVEERPSIDLFKAIFEPSDDDDSDDDSSSDSDVGDASAAVPAAPAAPAAPVAPADTSLAPAAAAATANAPRTAHADEPSPAAPTPAPDSRPVRAPSASGDVASGAETLVPSIARRGLVKKVVLGAVDEDGDEVMGISFGAPPRRKKARSATKSKPSKAGGASTSNAADQTAITAAVAGGNIWAEGGTGGDAGGDSSSDGSGDSSDGSGDSGEDRGRSSHKKDKKRKKDKKSKRHKSQHKSKHRRHEKHRHKKKSSSRRHSSSKRHRD